MRRILLFAVLIFTSSCVYYNTFFNAKQAFQRAERNQFQPKTQAASQYSWEKNRAAPPEEPAVAMTDKSLYKEAIDRANKVVLNHPKSKYVDDALWLVGKARYNMGEYIAAENKLTELVERFPNSRFVDEANFHIGLSRFWLKNYRAASESFGRIEQKKKSPLKDDAAFMSAYIEFISKDYSAALDGFERFVKEYAGSDSAATAQFFIGACRDSLKQPLEALRAYRKVKNMNPGSDLFFDAQFAFGLAAFKADSIKAGIEAFQSLSRQERYFERSGLIRLQLAKGKYLEGQTEQAIAEYNKIIEQFPNSAQSAEAYYQLGLIYLGQNDLARAKENLTKVSKEGQNQQIKKLAAARLGQLTKYESYLEKLGQKPAVVPASKIETGETSLADTTAAPDTGAGQPTPTPTEIDSTGHQASVIDSLSGSIIVESPSAVADSVGADSAGQEETAGIRFLLAELFYYDLERPDSALDEYLNLADQYPRSSYAAKALLAAAAIYLAREDSAAARGICSRIISEYPGTPQAGFARNLFAGEPLSAGPNAESYYNLAESLYFADGDKDSALAVFSYIEQTFPGSEYAAKSAFARAWIINQSLETDGDSSAYRAFSYVAENYAGTVYGRQAKIMLGLEKDSTAVAAQPEQVPVDVSTDTLATAEIDTVPQIPGLPNAPPPKDTGEFIYPEHLLSQKLKGRVTFKIKLDFVGTVIDYQLIGPSGNAAIDSAAIRALTQTVFDISYIDDLTKLNDYFRYDIKFAPPKLDEFYQPYQERREKGP